MYVAFPFKMNLRTRIDDLSTIRKRTRHVSRFWSVICRGWGQFCKGFAINWHLSTVDTVDVYLYVHVCHFPLFTE